MKIFNCVVCGKCFENQQPNAKTCSKQCRDEYNKKFYKPVEKYIHNCVICNKVFKHNQPHVKTCSKQCRDEYNKKFYKPVKKYIHNCSICDKKFEHNQPHVKYCSDDCREKVNYYDSKKSKEYSSKRKFINKENYNDIVSATVKEIIKRGIEGRDNCGISEYYSSYGFTSTLRDCVKQRDNYMCRICGKNHGLEVHHIIKVKHGGDNNLDNLITLCVSCHRAIDTLDLEHAIKRCKKNAEKHLNIVDKKDYRTINEKVEDIGFDLRAVYSILRKKGDDPDIQDVLIRFNDVLDEIDSIVGI